MPNTTGGNNKETGMNTIIYNKDNFTGDIATIKMTGKTVFKASNFHGKIKMVSPEIASVILDGEFQFTAYKIGSVWFCEDGDVSREDANPVVACLQVAHNVI
jgi:hypothetical protein